MDERAEADAPDRPGGNPPVGRWRAVVGAVVLALFVIWFVLSIFVLDAVVADAVSVAAVVTCLAGAAWLARKRGKGHAFMWLAASASIEMPFQLIHDIAAEHRWPEGQIHDILIARRIGAVPVLASLAMFGIALVREQRRAARAIAEH